MISIFDLFTIINPASGATEVTVNPANQLCYARGMAQGSGIDVVVAMCSDVSTTSDSEVVNNGRVVADQTGEWEENWIPTAVAGETNHLHVVTVRQNGSTDSVTNHFEAADEPVNCNITGGGGGGPGGLLTAGLDFLSNYPELIFEAEKRCNDETTESKAAEPRRLSGFVSHLGEFIQKVDDIVSYYHVSSDPRLVFPCHQDGPWHLYKAIPVDKPLGHVLGINGRPLWASSIEVAVKSMNVTRRTQAPFVNVTSPFGTGEISGTGWNFQSFPKFAAIVHQRNVPFYGKREQIILSSDREDPTKIAVDPTRKIQVVVNSPRISARQNEGFMDLWVKFCD